MITQEQADEMVNAALEEAAELALFKPRLAFMAISKERRERRELLREYGRRVAEAIRGLKRNVGTTGRLREVE